MATDIALVKVGGMAILFLLGFGGAVIPLCWKALKANPFWMGLANAFASGTFLGLGLVHMLPEADETLGDAYADKRVAPALALLGYALIQLLEAVLSGAHGGAHSHTLPTVVEVQEPGTQENNWVDKEASPGAADDDEDMLAKPANAGQHSTVEAWVMLVGLCVHSIFEGATIGLEDTSSGAMTMASSIAVHKGVAGFALGTSIMGAGLPMNPYVTCAIFALATPLGEAIGWIAEEDLPKVACAMFQALSAGTFLYIGKGELAPQELGATLRTRLWNWFTTLAAMACMYCMSVFLDFD
eukprot:TRINITY_DN3596_c0_g2_i1.p2 TRINITY_DN3596_c0_g2~~TRINITY_DN3596_c0_g2_i1.p2  ORF type:complete len:298 (+),score=101.58 TRINITY_DN3596_c0_g2_i1:790-1683(+)